MLRIIYFTYWSTIGKLSIFFQNVQLWDDHEVVLFTIFWVGKFIDVQALVWNFGMYICPVYFLYPPLYSIEELNTKRPTLVFFLAPTEPLQSYE
jgi:hypothetical protein